MEAPEEFMASNDMSHIVKGKRTKRQRPLSPLSLAMTTNLGGGEGGGGSSSGSGGDGGEDDCNFPSPTGSTEFAESVNEEEDMANCLILLAQGHSRDSPKPIEESGGVERSSRPRLSEVATTATGKAGFFIYECKTCNRCFPSFQALGGHRASHKKPKAMVEEKKALMVLSPEEEGQFNNNSPILSLHMGSRVLYSNNKSRVHECSICGSEFSSGQALGGHMRRHRSTPTTAMPASTTSELQETKKPRNVLLLDLNLPAPQEDDHRPPESKFSFSSKQQAPLVFSASTLVDCHY